ncbi:hypothetical protein F5883DRAFT_484595 [Diaporthe sp. PMI_573]|nr:hypothetical protein F5883DRAFT_484595 [Diaporthaceae sp. PMI_573]
MIATNNTVYVITGGNRGLGLGLVKALVSRPNTIVVATVRSEDAARSLQEEIGTQQANLRIAQLDFTRAIAPDEVQKTINNLLDGVDHIDVLINNAGSAQPMVPAIETTAEDLRAAFEVNAIAPLMVFQGLWPLLQKSPTGTPKAVWVTSSVGSISGVEDLEGLGAGAYGPSKAAQNFITKAIAEQNRDKGLIAVALHPGWVQTRAGQFVAEEWGVKSGPPSTIEDSVRNILNVVDTATGEISGKFITQKGVSLGW